MWSIRFRATAPLPATPGGRRVWLVRLAVTVMRDLHNGSMRRSTDQAASAWHNWAGNVTAQPRRSASPASSDEVAAEISRAAADGLTVRMTGTGHSFTPAAVT